MLGETGGKLPENFVITVPKVQLPEQVAAAAHFFEILEQRNGLPAGVLKIEPMIETPQAIINQRGEIALGSLVDAANGRCRSVHFGVYDYTASAGITAAYQTMGHPSCDFARQVMLVSLAGTGIHLSDGATNILPVGPHRASEDKPLTADQLRQNREAVHGAWRLGFDDNMHSLRTGFYQGWDLHPAQFVTRYAAVYSFFLDGLTTASGRLKTFVEKAALASLFGDVFDDALAAAVRHFQSRHGLPETGGVGPSTLFSITQRPFQLTGFPVHKARQRRSPSSMRPTRFSNGTPAATNSARILGTSEAMPTPRM